MSFKEYKERVIRMEIENIDIYELRNDVYKTVMKDCDVYIKENVIIVNTHLYGINFYYIKTLVDVLNKKYQLKLIFVYSDKNMINLEFHN